MVRNGSRALGALVSLCLVLTAVPSFAGICFTSGKVYIQQKVWDKAALQLECARKQEPQNLQVYLLLGSARAELHEYASAGAAFRMGIDAAKAKKDDKKAGEIRNNQQSYMTLLYNNGVKVMSTLKSVETVEEQEGAQRLFLPTPAPESAILDTTAYSTPPAGSPVQVAAYWFRLAALVDPSEVNIYRNLSFLYGAMGNTDDAMAAAREGLRLAPNDPKLDTNLRVAAVGRANRLFAAQKYAEAVVAYRKAIENDPGSKLVYVSQIAQAEYNIAQGMDEKDPKRGAAYDSVIVAYKELLQDAPKDSLSIREGAYYNMGVILASRGNNTEALKFLDAGVAEFPKSKDLLSLDGQTKYQANDFNGAITALKAAEALDPKDPSVHQFLFLSLNKLNKQNESVAEYSIYKALSDGKPRTGGELKVWIDSAANRLGAKEQLTKTKTSAGYPEEVRVFHDEGGKALESWFYWSKGKVITFMDGQVLSQATFPPSKP